MLKSFAKRLWAAATYAPVEPPKVKKGGQALLSFLTSARPSKTSPLPSTDRRLASTDITSYRNGRTTKTQIRDFVAASPDLSASVFAYIRNAVSQDYVAMAKNLDGTLNVEATTALAQVLVRFDILTDYANGYASLGSILSASESIVKELMHYGSASAELVLDKALLPARIQPVSTVHIKFYPDSKGGLRPVQEIGSEKIPLDTPAFAYVSLDQDLLDPYSASPLEAALQPVLFGHEFMNDVRRIVQRVIHPRLTVELDEEKLTKRLTDEAQTNPEKRTAEINEIIETIRSIVEGLEPEEALVHLDSMGVSVLDRGQTSLADEYEIINKFNDAKMATGSKTMPAILGHGVASSNIASTETMLFMRYVQGIQAKINELYSRLLTVALRLMGYDVYVEFRYRKTDLRPDSELEGFKAVKQSRFLELLSLGMISDEEACIELTGHLPPAGYKPLSGTMFKVNPAEATGDTSSNKGSALNKNLSPGTSESGRGQNNKADPQKNKQGGDK